MLEIIKKYNNYIKCFIFVLLVVVYGDLFDLFKSDQLLILLLLLYVIDKYYGEWMILNYCLLYNILIVVVKFFNVFGLR